MKCLVCDKREATIAFTHVVEQDKKLVYLCETCYDQQGESSAKKPEPPPVPVEEEKKVAAAMEKMKFEPGQLAQRCSSCGMSYEEFKKLGRFGCGRCYTTFSEQMERLLKRIHGAVSHAGKGPIEVKPALPPDEELQELRQQLQQAVDEEEYEQAADLRDRIAFIERDLNR